VSAHDPLDAHLADDALAVGERLFGALSSGDFATYEGLMSPDARIWTNFDGRDVDAATASRTVRWLMTKVSGLRYEIVRREATDGGFVQQHVLHGHAPDGTALAMPACIWVTVEDGLVTRMEEYLDPAGVAALLR